jgi:tryptophan synthase alpha chain
MGTDGTVGGGRIRAVFDQAAGEGRAALVAYVVAGYPEASSSVESGLACIDAGADLLEVGLPYSDPLADGVTLQRASAAAIAAGTDLAGSLDVATRIAAARPATPVLVMGYANHLGAGTDPGSVTRRVAAAGVAGMIVPDLTPDEGEPLECAARDAGLALVYLVAPTSGRERARWIAERSGGFLYAVALLGVTGARRTGPGRAFRAVLDVVREAPVPVAVGFGISRPSHVRQVVRAGAQGVVVGSALVDALGDHGRDIGALTRLVGDLRAATSR